MSSVHFSMIISTPIRSKKSNVTCTLEDDQPLSDQKICFRGVLEAFCRQIGGVLEAFLRCFWGVSETFLWPFWGVLGAFRRHSEAFWRRFGGVLRCFRGISEGFWTSLDIIGHHLFLSMYNRQWLDFLHWICRLEVFRVFLEFTDFQMSYE